MFFLSFCSGVAVFLSLFSLCIARPFALRDAVTTLDTTTRTGTRGFDVPILRRKPGVAKRGIHGSIGLGDNSDLLYSVPVEFGSTTTALNLDTGSSDLWVISDLCQTTACKQSSSKPFPSAKFNASGVGVALYYGDSTTGTNATGPIGQSTVAVAGIAMPNQYFAAINFTTNSVVQFGAAGIFGLGFPSGSVIQQNVVNKLFNKSAANDALVSSTQDTGPLLSRVISAGGLDNPMFSITLQRDTVDIGGNGTLSVGKLPDGIDNSTITWVPVRLYSVAEGGMSPPSFAPNEVYPYRWEVDLDAVYLDGKPLPLSTLPTPGLNSTKMSALIDTGNSLIRGPEDVVDQILTTVSPVYDPQDSGSMPMLPCSTPHTLAFQIGGKMFPIDPRDFISPGGPRNAKTCVASSVVSTDPPSVGALFSWSLGDPFFKSNLVVFHYGNLMQPSLDPPRIGFRSLVPANANTLLTEAVQDAAENGGAFETTFDAAPTASAAAEPEVTITPSSVVIPTSSAATVTPSANGDNVASVTPAQSPAPSASAADRQKSSAIPAQSKVLSVFYIISIASLFLLG